MKISHAETMVLEGGPEAIGPILWRDMTNLSIFISFYLFIIYKAYLWCVFNVNIVPTYI